VAHLALALERACRLLHLLVHDLVRGVLHVGHRLQLREVEHQREVHQDGGHQREHAEQQQHEGDDGDEDDLPAGRLVREDLAARQQRA